MANEKPPTTHATAKRCLPGLIGLALLATVGSLQDAHAAGEARTAQRAEPRITVASAIVGQPASLVPLPIQVGPSDALPSNSFLRLRGLPPTISLTEGHAIGPGSWAIPLVGLPALKANVPA